MRLVLAATLAVLSAGSARAAPALADYGRLPAVEAITLSPSGEQVAMIAVVGEGRRVLAMSTEGKLRLAAQVGKLKVRDLDWVGEDRILVGVSQTVNLPFVFAAKYEMGVKLNVDLKSGKTDGVLGHNSNIYPAVMRDYGVRQIDGHWYGYFGAITLEGRRGETHLGHGYADLYRVDLEGTGARRLAEGSEIEHDWAVAPDGTITARSEYQQTTGAWRLLPGSSGGRPLMERQAPLDDIDLVGFGRTPDTLLVADDTGDQDVVEEQPLSGGAPSRLFDDDEIRSLLYAAKSRLLIGSTLRDDRGAILFDPKAQARFNGTRKAFPGYEVQLVSYTDDFSRMIVFTDGGDDSGTYWIVNIATGKALILGRAYPTIEAKDVGPTRLIHYKAADGMELDGFLTLPPGGDAKKLPVVIMPHGGPIGVHDDIGFDWWAQAFASRGYAVFQPNFRGSGGHGEAYQQAGYGQWGRKMQTDVSDGLTEIARQGIVDPKRACIVGGSYGGYAALAGVTLQQGIYRCAVSYGGVSDLFAMLTDVAKRHGGNRTDVSRFWKAAMGVKGTSDGLLNKLSPASLADKADAPILLIHGKEDTVVNPDQTAHMAAALKRADKPFEVKMLDGEDHWMSREQTRLATLEASVAFVEKYDPAH
jgi:dipeptidyl aminopeptidase/acylaminoacyl peptidase